MIIFCNSVSGAVTDLRVTTAEQSAVLMASVPTVTNGIIRYYEASYGVVGSDNDTVNITTDDQSLNGTIEMLLPFTNYTFSVRACTIAGCGPISNVVTEMTLEDGELTLCMLII